MALRYKILHSGMTVISGSTQVDYNSIQNKPTTIETASYVDYSNVSNKPSLVSGSAQVLNGSGIYSSSVQLPSGLISGSSQVTMSYSVSASYAHTALNAFIQGGNSFGATASFGTNDAYPIKIETNGNQVARFEQNGDLFVGSGSYLESPSILGRGAYVQRTNGQSGFYATSITNLGGTSTFAQFVGSVAAGTPSSITPSYSGSGLSLTMRGWDGSTWHGGGEILISPTQTWSAGSGATNMRFTVTPSGSSTQIEAMRIEENGNVGVGISTPTVRLHISGSGGVSQDLVVNGRIMSGDGIQAGGMSLGGSGSLAAFIGQSTSQNLGIWMSQSAWVMMASQSGYVAMGNCNVFSANADLHVSGGRVPTAWTEARLDSPSTSGSSFTMYEGGTKWASIQHVGSTNVIGSPRKGNLEIGTALNGSIDFRPNDVSRLYVSSSGNVGIGTSTPYGSFCISNPSIILPNKGSPWVYHVLQNQVGSGSVIAFVEGSTAGKAYIQYNSETTADLGTNRRGNLEFMTVSSSNNFDFRPMNGASSALFISSSGMIGLGTQTPLTNLHIVSTNPLWTEVRLDHQSPSGSVLNMYENGSRRSWISTVGTTNIAPAIRRGNLELSTILNGNIDLRPNDTSRLYISSSGFVGVGTQTPTAQLTVQNNATASSGGTGAMLQVVGPDNTGNPVRFVMDVAGTNAGGDAPSIYMRRGRGTQAALTPLLSGDGLGTIVVCGPTTNGTYGTNISQAGFGFSATQNWSAGSAASAIQFYTTPSGSTSNSERMRLDSTGFLGINTTAPTARLHVSGSGTTNTDFIVNGRVMSGDSTNNGGLTLGNYKGFVGQTGSDQFCGFWTSQSNWVLTVSQSGFTAIGPATSPDSRLTVANQATISPALAGTVVHVVGADGSGNPARIGLDIAGANAGDYPQILTRRGRGTQASLTPVQSGDILGMFAAGGCTSNGTYGVNAQSVILFAASQNFSAGSAGAYTSFYTTPSGSINGSERVRIAETGFVGVGSTAPGALLTVNNTTSASAVPVGTVLQVISTDTAYQGGVSVDVSGNSFPTLILRRSRGTSAIPTPVQANDALGFIQAYGSNASGSISAAVGGIGFFAASNWNAGSTPSYVFISTVPSGSTTAIERMRIDSVGNVGINNTTPTATLDVSGSMELTGSFSLSGSVRFDISSSTGANTATFTNSPVSGNPTGWVTININGTDRKMPYW